MRFALRVILLVTLNTTRNYKSVNLYKKNNFHFKWLHVHNQIIQGFTVPRNIRLCLSLCEKNHGWVKLVSKCVLSISKRIQPSAWTAFGLIWACFQIRRIWPDAAGNRCVQLNVSTQTCPWMHLLSQIGHSSFRIAFVCRAFFLKT